MVKHTEHIGLIDFQRRLRPGGRRPLTIETKFAIGTTIIGLVVVLLFGIVIFVWQ